MARKTIDVVTLIDTANSLLALSHDDKAQGREGIAMLVESLLMASGNYKGFRHTDGNNGDTDSTRRAYYTSGRLTHS